MIYLGAMRSDFLSSSYSTANPDVPDEPKTTGGWNQFAVAFLVGGIGNALVEDRVYGNLDLLKAILMRRIYFFNFIAI